METQSWVWLLIASYLLCGFVIWLIQTFLPKLWWTVIGEALHKLYPEWSLEELHSTIYHERLKRRTSTGYSIAHSFAVATMWPALIYVLSKK